MLSSLAMLAGMTPAGIAKRRALPATGLVAMYCPCTCLPCQCTSILASVGSSVAAGISTNAPAVSADSSALPGPSALAFSICGGSSFNGCLTLTRKGSDDIASPARAYWMLMVT
ncbi:hypothetical protein D3C73_1164290 [compost metagenome]